MEGSMQNSLWDCEYEGIEESLMSRKNEKEDYRGTTRWNQIHLKSGR